MTTPESRKNIKVLVVDDEPHIVMVLQDNLEMMDFVVETAVNGLEALEKVAASRPDVIILDVGMPKMDGWETCRRLKGSLETSGIPIIFLTAFAQKTDREKAMSLGAARFITKPFQPEAIGQAIKSVLEGH